MNPNSRESEPPAQSPVREGAESELPPPIDTPVERVPRAPKRPLPRRSRVLVARLVAVAADVLQLALMPLFMAGALSPVDDVIDVFVGVVLTWLVGWHWAFLPTFIAELVPFVDLVPSWTLAAFIATRGDGTRGDGKSDPPKHPQP